MTSRRLALGTLALGLARLTAGCAVGPQAIPAAELTGDGTYDWDTEATVTYNVTGDAYSAIFDLENRSSLQVYGHGTLGGEQPIDVTNLRYRFPNGTVVTANHSGLAVTRESKRTNITLPETGGMLAYAGDRNGKEFTSPVFLEGSWRVTLPVSARVGVPLLSTVRPGGFDRSLADNRLTLHWTNVTASSVHARWYLEFDLLLFATVGVVGVTLAVGGTVYYLRQIRRLERRREEVGLEVETEDDDPRDRGPPPGRP
jgi:hypothetical protein